MSTKTGTCLHTNIQYIYIYIYICAHVYTRMTTWTSHTHTCSVNNNYNVKACGNSQNCYFFVCFICISHIVTPNLLYIIWIILFLLIFGLWTWSSKTERFIWYYAKICCLWLLVWHLCRLPFKDRCNQILPLIRAVTTTDIQGDKSSFSDDR